MGVESTRVPGSPEGIKVGKKRQKYYQFLIKAEQVDKSVQFSTLLQ